MTHRILTGVTTTGIPHLGNYVGAIRPAIRAAAQDNAQSYLFLANYHGIIKCHDPAMIDESTRAVAATWLACGLDTERTTFYRQSDIPEILELNWILTCITAKGLMNRAHAYKAAVDKNIAENQDPDYEIEMGLYSYPILMTADILMFKANSVPVGRDQIQHVEMARDIAQRFNHRFGKEIFVLPEAAIDENVQLLVGLDGRKMSKSYGNTIPLFQTPKQRQKSVNKIVTNLKEPGEPKQKDESPLFQKTARCQNRRRVRRQNRCVQRFDCPPLAHRRHLASGRSQSPRRSERTAGGSQRRGGHSHAEIVLSSC